MSDLQKKVEATLNYMSEVSDPPPGKTKSRAEFIAVVASRAHLPQEEVAGVLDAALGNLQHQGINVGWAALNN